MHTPDVMLSVCVLQMLLCVFCDSLVPINTQTCLICEAAIERQLQPQASRTMQVCKCVNYAGLYFR